MSDELLLSYLAGFFDGEGTVCIAQRKGKRASFSMKIQVGQMERAPLELFLHRFGGNIYESSRAGKKSLLLWALCKRDLQRAFLELLIPHLRSKKAEAQLGIRFLNVMRTIGFGGHGARSDPELLAERVRLHAACKAAKIKDWRLHEMTIDVQMPMVIKH